MLISDAPVQCIVATAMGRSATDGRPLVACFSARFFINQPAARKEFVWKVATVLLRFVRACLSDRRDREKRRTHGCIVRKSEWLIIGCLCRLGIDFDSVYM